MSGPHAEARVRSPASLGLLGVLAFCLPFEPRRPTLDVAGLQFTLLEGLAALALVASVRTVARSRWRFVFEVRPACLALLWAYVAAHALSAAFAAAQPVLATKFTLRMVAAAILATVVAALPTRLHRPLVRAFVASAMVVAALAVLEGLGVRGLDPVLDLFREGPYHVGTMRRASAASENPNLAAALLAAALVGGAALQASGANARRSLALAVLLSAGLLSTYSRGGLAAAFVGLLALGVALRVRSSTRVLPAAASAGVLAAVAVLFAVSGLTLGFRVSTGIDGPANGARYELRDDLLRLAPGDRRDVAVTAVNTGETTWTSGGDFDLVFYWFDVRERRLHARHALPLARTVPPGAHASFALPVVAPAPGRYLLVVGMNDGRSGTFESQGTPPAVLPAVIGDEGAVRTDPPSADALPRNPGVSRPELWRTALAMWRAHPVTGVGSDNFRWLRGAYSGAGRAREDARWPANNTYLEVAATTGTLGLVAFLGTLVATACTAWKHAGMSAGNPEGLASGAVVFALTVAFAAHAAVDYFLGFTGHYLLFGLVVGLAASLDVSARTAPVSGAGS